MVTVALGERVFLGGEIAGVQLHGLDAPQVGQDGVADLVMGLVDHADVDRGRAVAEVDQAEDAHDHQGHQQAERKSRRDCGSRP